jgi:tetratricopeptide (TPR) repeat protein
MLTSEMQSVEAYLQLAADLLKHRQFKMAVDYCRLSIQAQPTARGYKLLGDGLQQLGQMTEAEQAYQRGLQLQPDQPEAYANLGSLYAQQQQWPKALLCYRRAMTLKPLPAIERNLERAWAGIRQSPQSIEAVYEVVLQSPQQLSARDYLQLGEIWQQQQQTERAVICYRHALQQNPDLVEAQQQIAKLVRAEQRQPVAPVQTSAAVAKLCQQGDQCRQNQNWQQAAAFYQQAVEAEPELAQAHWALAQMLERLGRLDEAVERYFTALSLQPTLAKPAELCKFGQWFGQQEKLEQALCCYEWALQQDGQLAEAQFQIAEICSRQERYEEAVTSYRKAIALKPEARSWHGLGDALTKLQRWQEAVEAYRQAIALNPEFSWSHNNLGDALMHLEQWEAAAKAYEQAIELNPEFHWSHYNLGEALTQLEHWDESIKAYSQALEINSDFTWAARKLGDILYKKKSDTELALSHYVRALAIDPDHVETYHKALEIAPKNISLYQGLTDALRRQGQVEQAATFSRIAQQIERDLTYRSIKPQFDVRLIAFFLPQFHPIPENDLWWGKGFTEWTNVTKATPLFEGHYQPKLPADLGFYDLRLPEARESQADLAKKYGIHGFCYYYYWFAGKRLLHRPIDDMLATGRPDFPFCLCWANENWSRRWDGSEHDILVAQEHSPENNQAFAESLVPFLRNKQYIQVNGKPLILVYRADILPDIANMLQQWREIFRKKSIGEVYLCGVLTFGITASEIVANGFDAAVQFPPHNTPLDPYTSVEVAEIGVKDFAGRFYNFKEAVIQALKTPLTEAKTFPGVMTGWDNTARKGKAGYIFLHNNPDLYALWLRGSIEKIRDRQSDDERIVFVNAWNEWAEGTYLEPDRKNGHAYLLATAKALQKTYDWQTVVALLRYLPIESANQLGQLIDELEIKIKATKNSLDAILQLSQKLKRKYWVLSERQDYYSNSYCYYIDSLQINQIFRESDIVTISGWFLHQTSRGSRVEVLENGRLVSVGNIDELRLDVFEKFKEYNTKNSGFHAYYRIDQHFEQSLEIFIRLEDDTRHKICSFRFTKHQEPVEIPIPIDIRKKIDWDQSHIEQIENLLTQLNVFPIKDDFQEVLDELNFLLTLRDEIISELGNFLCTPGADIALEGVQL